MSECKYCNEPMVDFAGRPIDPDDHECDVGDLHIIIDELSHDWKNERQRIAELEAENKRLKEYFDHHYKNALPPQRELMNAFLKGEQDG